MGKAADNESIRLRATFYNNLAAGLILTGILLPGMAFTQVGYELGKWIKAWRAGTAAVSYDAMAHGYIVLGAVVIAFLLARLFRSLANKEIARIQD